MTRIDVSSRTITRALSTPAGETCLFALATKGLRIDQRIELLDETTGRRRAGTVVGLSGDYDVMVVF